MTDARRAGASVGLTFDALTIEGGVPNSDMDFWVGAFVPKKTPRDVVAKMQAEIVKAINNPAMRHATHASLDVVDDGTGIFRARIVGGDDRQVRKLGRNAAHEGPLAPVPIAAGPKHHDEPPFGERPQGGERPLKRIWGVGVVTEDYARSIGDPLHPPGHLSGHQRRSDAVRVKAQFGENRQCQQGIRVVVDAGDA